MTNNDARTYGIAPPGHRLPSATRLGRVRLQVADLQRSLRWYTQTLGLQVTQRNGADAALDQAGAHSALVELHERPGAAPVPQRGRLGLYHYAILLPDRAALARFTAHLNRIGTQFGASDHRVSEALYLRDPDGLGIEVYADRPRAEWRHHAGQLVMATDPLDLRSLTSAAGGEEWSGMPAGTVVGHIHLHVGDLARAEAFYHQALGLDKVVWSYPGALFLSAGGYHHHLGLNTWAVGAEPAAEEDARLLDWEILVPSAEDARDALGSMAAAGYASSDEGLVRDPWGTALRIRSADAQQPLR